MLMACPEVMLKKNQTELRVKFINQSQVVFKSGDSFDSLRGSTLHGVVVDEVRDQHPDLWEMVLRPMLATTRGWGLFVSTPNGFDQFFDFSQNALTDPDWETFSAPSTCNPLFTQEEFEASKRGMSEAKFAQEIMAEFRDLTSGKAYINASQANMRETNPFTKDGSMLSPHLPIIVGLDFNVGLMAWTLAQTHLGEWYFFDEVAIRNTNTQEAVPVLIDKVRGHKPGVILVGDATGNARKTSAAGNTDYSIIMEALKTADIPFQNRTPESNPLVKDRVNVMNAKLRDANGVVHLWIHPKRCPYLKKDFERVVWKENANGAILDQVRDKDLTHASDSAGYPVHLMTDPWKVSPGVTRVIRR